MAGFQCPSCPSPLYAVLALLIPVCLVQRWWAMPKPMLSLPRAPSSVPWHILPRAPALHKGCVSLFAEWLPLFVWRRVCWEGKLPRRTATQVRQLPVSKPKDLPVIKEEQQRPEEDTANAPGRKGCLPPWLAGLAVGFWAYFWLNCTPFLHGMHFLRNPRSRKGVIWWRDLVSEGIVCYLVSTWTRGICYFTFASWGSWSTWIRSSRAPSAVEGPHYAWLTAQRNTMPELHL